MLSIASLFNLDFLYKRSYVTVSPDLKKSYQVPQLKSAQDMENTQILLSFETTLTY